jgi:hypothetical protein
LAAKQLGGLDLRFKSLLGRRPSAPLVVSFAALFVALGGVGYAASQLPPNSVGTAQLQNGSVGNFKLKSGSVGPRKIINGAVGAQQVNLTQVQLRVFSTCSSGAISAVNQSGSVNCTPTLPNEFGTSAAGVTVGISPTNVATKPLPAGSSYLVLAYPHAVISGQTNQHVEVDCTLSVPSTGGTLNPNKNSNTLAVDLGSGSQSDAGTIPLVLPVASATSAETATVSCFDTTTQGTQAPVVTVDSTLNAIQTASNS